MNSLIKRPSAWLPIIMSITALAIVIGYVTIFGIVHETDEGIVAHVFQLLMILQVPIIVFFAVKWLPQNPRSALKVLSLQFIAALAAFTALFIFEHI